MQQLHWLSAFMIELITYSRDPIKLGKILTKVLRKASQKVVIKNQLMCQFLIRNPKNGRLRWFDYWSLGEKLINSQRCQIIHMHICICGFHIIRFLLNYWPLWPSYKENIRIQWQWVMVTFLPIPEGVICNRVFFSIEKVWMTSKTAVFRRDHFTLETWRRIAADFACRWMDEAIFSNSLGTKGSSTYQRVKTPKSRSIFIKWRKSRGKGKAYILYRQDQYLDHCGNVPSFPPKQAPCCITPFIIRQSMFVTHG